MRIADVEPRAATQIPEPPIARFLFADTRMAWVWLIIRLYVGYEWLAAGWDKLTGYSIELGPTFGKKVATPWVFTSHSGAAITGFVQGALAKNTPPHPAVQDWYAWFLRTFVQPAPAFWAYLITFGELAVGLGLIVGLLTGIAAFFGLFMNMNYLLAGTVSTNPILGVLALFIVLAWRVAGYYGLDRYVLPLLGTPWTGPLPGKSAERMPGATRTPAGAATA
jgi:thiosulfate dehydrogenase [quinone] large subunit